MRNAAMRKLFVGDALYVAKHRNWCCLRFSNSSLYVEHNPGLQEQRVQNAEIGCCIAYRIVDVGEMIFKKCTWVQCTSLCDVNVLEMPRACLQFNHCDVLNDSNQQNHVGDRPFKSSRCLVSIFYFAMSAMWNIQWDKMWVPGWARRSRMKHASHRCYLGHAQLSCMCTVSKVSHPLHAHLSSGVLDCVYEEVSASGRWIWVS